jgi:dolichol-phosphate mannosyltransferase
VIFSLVIPVYNEEATLDYSLDRVIRSCLALFEKGISGVELILVNDGSRDRSQEVLERWAHQPLNERVNLKILEFSRNFGHSGAVLAGLEASQGDVVGIIDADVQDPPELLADMVAVLQVEKVDVVYGQRIQRTGDGHLKRKTAWIFYRLIDLLTGVEIPKDTGDFRVMRKSVVKSVLRCREQDPFIRGVVAWVGFKQLAFPYVRESRKFGESKYPLRKMIRFATLAIVSFSSKPLMLSLYLGFFGLCFSSLMTVWVLLSWLHGGTVPGWASTSIFVAMSQSFVLILLGIQGLYVARIHDESLGRPRYIIRSQD